MSSEPVTTSTHPLDPLSTEEVATATAIVRASEKLSDRAQFHVVRLAEPEKDWSGAAADRRVAIVVYDRADGSTYEVVVSLGTESVVSWELREDVQPCILAEESIANAANVMDSPQWQAALRKRGIEDLESVQVDVWMAGYFGLDHDRSGRRLGRALAYLRPDGKPNPYAHPIDGLEAVVDRDTGEVVEVIDHGIVPIASDPGEYATPPDGSFRDDLKPLEITQPDGPSFTIDGSELTWQRWRMRVSLDPVEGLVLRTVAYRDGDEERPILYRASLSEMVVPYGDTAPTLWWRNAFDAGEAGLGQMSNSLEYGCDCVGHVEYLDGVVSGATGEARVIKNAICIHEEDYGILWKHTDFWTDEAEVRRSRRLVVSSFATVANYEYGFFWYFYLDGTIQCEVKLTGIVLAKTRKQGADPFAHPLTAELSAPHHQHIFCFRLDFDVDGEPNAVYELEAEPLPDHPDNVWGNAFTQKETLLSSEREAERETNSARVRQWKVVNRGRTNAVGNPVGYRLVPGPTATLLANRDSWVAKRAGFARSNLWVTRYEPDELHAAGDYPNQHPGGDGLPAWVERDGSIVDQDLVVWYSMCATHFSRPEDWPVMPVEYASFTIRPDGFFDANPALDVPPQPPHCAG